MVLPDTALPLHLPTIHLLPPHQFSKAPWSLIWEIKEAVVMGPHAPPAEKTPEISPEKQ